MADSIRVGPANEASAGVARNCGFTYVRDFSSATDTHDDGTPVTLSLYLLDLLKDADRTLMARGRALSGRVSRYRVPGGTVRSERSHAGPVSWDHHPMLPLPGCEPGDCRP